MTPTPLVDKSKTPAASGQLLTPPDEQFWVRYSPHHEFPLSTVISVCFYVLLGITAVVCYYVLAPLFSGKSDPIPLETVALGGAGGIPGEPGSGGDGGDKTPVEDLGDQHKLAQENKPPVALSEMPRPDVKVETVPVDPKDAEAVRYITNGNISAESLSKVGQDASAMLMKQVGGKSAGKNSGTGGTGGTGGDGGDGRLMNERQKRVLRWTMMFDTRTGDDYRVQLLALGAILGIPGPDGQYRIIRDLKQKPARLETEDLKKINRIFWVDDRPDSIGPLAQALGIPAPQHVVAFFPEKLEGELLRKERAFANRKENEILETRFRVVRSGSSYQPIVVDQRAAR
jgi:hypothetical protein